MDKTIEQLTGAERIRRRPAVVFGDAGLDGSKRVFTELVRLLLPEVSRGFCTRVDIALYKNGTIALKTNGRGFYIGENDQKWKDIFAELPFKSYFDVPHGEQAFSLYEESGLTTKEERYYYDDLSLVCCQSVCQYMDCIIFRGGREHNLHFEQGVPKSKESSVCDQGKQGMQISFLIDPSVFNKQHILPTEFVVAIAQTAATRLPGLLVSVKAENNDGWVEHIFGTECKVGSREENK